MEILLTSILTGIVTGAVWYALTEIGRARRENRAGLERMKATKFTVPAKALKKRRKKRGPRITTGSAKNALAVLNSVVDQQKIRTAEIEIPVIAEDVLSYEPGELGPAYPDKTRLFYPKDAISDPDYLETVMRSPLQVQTHQKNTTEYNRDVDGWPTKAWWDDTAKRVMLKGVLHGEENVKYAEENKHLPGFGTSAFISFLRIEKTAGTAPNGKPYDAVVRKAVNNHVAIMQGVRDPKNVIVAMNAVESEKTVDLSTGSAHNVDSAPKTPPEGKRMPIDKSDFKEAMHAYMAEEKEESEKAERIKNAIKNELKDESSKAVTSTATGAGNAPESSGKDGSAKNFPHAKEETSSVPAAKEKTETATASNALPSEEMVKDFSTHLGVKLENPTLSYLGSLVGVKATEPAELISALNAKRTEWAKPAAQAQNSGTAETGTAPSLRDLMAAI